MLSEPFKINIMQRKTFISLYVLRFGRYQNFKLLNKVNLWSFEARPWIDTKWLWNMRFFFNENFPMNDVLFRVISKWYFDKISWYCYIARVKIKYEMKNSEILSVCQGNEQYSLEHIKIFNQPDFHMTRRRWNDSFKVSFHILF